MGKQTASQIVHYLMLGAGGRTILNTVSIALYAIGIIANICRRMLGYRYACCKRDERQQMHPLPPSGTHVW